MQRNTDLIRSEEAAVILGVSSRTIERLRADGKIGAFKRGTGTYFSRREIRAFKRAQEQREYEPPTAS